MNETYTVSMRGFKWVHGHKEGVQAALELTHALVSGPGGVQLAVSAAAVSALRLRTLRLQREPVQL